MESVHYFVRGLFRGIAETEKIAEQREELEAHINDRITDSVALGMTHNKAFADAIDSLGNLDELIETMNHAAELAVVEAKPILVNAVKNMSFDDARGILTGGDDAATQYFRRATSADLTAKFLPVVKQATAKVELADKYNDYAGKAAKMGLLDKKDANLDQYVTQKALDGLFLMVAEQEKAIRKDPMSTGSALLKKIFGG